MKTRLAYLLSSAFLPAFLSILSPAIATAQPQSAPAKTGDDVVEMSPFVVTSQTDDGYGASMTASGSRVAEKIINLPYKIEVITAEFMEDLGFTDLGEDFAYASSFGGFDPGSGQVNMRGTGVGKQLRNGFLRIGVLDRANVERIEIIKGPSAAIYGEALPSGLINIVTKKPKNKKTAKLATRVGPNHLFRSDFEATGPLVSPKTAFIVNASYLKQGYEQDYAALRTSVFSAAVQHKFTPTTTLLVEAEYIERHAVPQAPVPVKRTKAGTRNEELAMEIANFNWYGPYELTHRDITTFGATFEHRFSTIFSTRVATNWSRRNVEGHSNNASGGVNPTYHDSTAPTAANREKLTGFVPAFGESEEGTYGVQADLLAHYWLFSGAMENKTLFTFDFSNFSRKDPRYISTAALASPLGFPSVQDPKNPKYFWPDPELYPDIYSLDRYNDCSTDVLGFFLRHQTALWGGRFIVVGGIRFDRVMEDLRNETLYRRDGASAISIVDRADNHYSPNIGINTEITKGLRAYANYATSFFVQSQQNNAPDVAGGDTSNEQNEGGFGFDYGIKVETFGNRLKFTLGGYYIVRENVRVTDEEGNFKRVGQIFSRGLEFDATYRIDKPLFTTNITFGYGLTNAKYTNAGRDLDMLGRQLAGQPKHNAYVAWNQVWKKGFFRGFRTTIGVTYTGESNPWTDRGGTSTTLPNGKTYIFSNSGYREILIDDYFSTRASIAYQWKFPGQPKWQHELSVSFVNLFDQHIIQRNRQMMDSFNWSVAYTIKL